MYRIAIAAISLILASCSTKPIIQTQIVEKPVPVYCNVAMPAECKDSYAVDRVSAADDAVTINRALRTEIEERWMCEIKLRAAVKGCNKGQLSAQ
jgi:hypothetical protein